MSDCRTPARINIGTAGWSIPKQHAAAFPGDGSHLERYARRLPAVEINSSFYRPHRRNTYARWAAAVPSGFRFAVKLPREITHARRLVDCADPLERFLAEAGALGDRLGPLLMQLPPSLAFDPVPVGRFLALLRARFSGPVVCEPRHSGWFIDGADDLLARFEVARAAADPAPAAGAGQAGGWNGIAYHRLHGAPKMYYSGYSSADIDRTAALLAQAARRASEVWCIFDNTAEGRAAGDALTLLARLG